MSERELLARYVSAHHEKYAERVCSQDVPIRSKRDWEQFAPHRGHLSSRRSSTPPVLCVKSGQRRALYDLVVWCMYHGRIYNTCAAWHGERRLRSMSPTVQKKSGSTRRQCTSYNFETNLLNGKNEEKTVQENERRRERERERCVLRSWRCICRLQSSAPVRYPKYESYPRNVGVYAQSKNPRCHFPTAWVAHDPGTIGDAGGHMFLYGGGIGGDACPPVTESASRFIVHDDVLR